jgi:hypothetical protein
MALEWLKAGFRGRQYTKAIDQLQAQLAKRRSDPRLKLQLAELLIQAKRPGEALPFLESVADDFALQGFAARAIAVLKRIVALDPTNSQAEEKLAYLIAQENNPAPSPWRAAAEKSRGLEIGMEEVDDSAIGMEELPAGETDASAQPEAEGAHNSAPDAPGFADVDLADPSVRHEFLSLIDMAFSPETPALTSGLSTGMAGSPLFGDFSPEELIAVMRGMRLVTFEPGEIIVSQGEAGQSLFVLASGQARAYLKDKQGRNVQVRELLEGDFFGEIALMLGSPRTATITARTRCELLELDRLQLDAIAKDRPRVRQVLQVFYAKRINTTVDGTLSPGGH